MKKLSFSRSLVCVSLLALLSAGASAAEKVTLKLAHNLNAATLFIRRLSRWRKRLTNFPTAI